MLLNLITALLLSVPAGNTSQDVETIGCNHAADSAFVQFDETLIAQPPIDSASVEATILSGMHYKMLPTHGRLVRFIVYDDRLQNGEGTFAFNTQTFELTLEQNVAATNHPEFSFAVAHENSAVQTEQAGFAGCYYRFTGPTQCFQHVWYGYFCLDGGWYCVVFGSCKWIGMGSCR